MGQPVNSPLRPALQQQLHQLQHGCSHCRRCVAECPFLQRWGDPGHLAERYQPVAPWLAMPFECSLCGLCRACCPAGLDPQALLLEMRRQAVDQGAGDFPAHRPWLRYEQRGTSKRYSWYALPEGCDTLFFPGCALPGSRPGLTLQLFRYLQQSRPRIGMVLDCCTKPSHDLGREVHFQTRFGELKAFLAARGIRQLLVACPSCYRIFNDYAPEFETRTVYEWLDGNRLPVAPAVSGRFFLHDPCVVRFAPAILAAVRSLAQQKGVTVIPSHYSGERTLCCGAGGAAGYYAPDLAGVWTRKRLQEATGERILTYCAGCVRTLASRNPTCHLLDLLFAPEAAMSRWKKGTFAPFTYLNRLRVKRYLRRHVETAGNGDRSWLGAGRAGEKLFRRLLRQLRRLWSG